MEKTISGVNLNVDGEGYLQDISQWNKEIAVEIAKEEGVGELNDDHWKVIDYLQEQFKNGAALTIRSVGKSGVTDIKGFYSLFPDGPLKKASKIAGIKKPVSCI